MVGVVVDAVLPVAGWEASGCRLHYSESRDALGVPVLLICLGFCMFLIFPSHIGSSMNVTEICINR